MMKRYGFIKATVFDEKLEPKEREPIGTALVNIDEIAMIACHGIGSVIYLKDYKTKVFVFESEKELQMKINATKDAGQS